MLIEVLVSALVLTVATAGVVVLLQTTTKTQAEQRHNTEAYAIAQEDQARLSSMRLSALNALKEERTVTLNKRNFTVRSYGVFINDTTSTPSCGEGTSSADYVEITSVVTWKGMDPGEKAKIVSILSPSNGSLDPNNGTIAFSVKTQQQVPIPGVLITGGSGAFSGETDAAGCAVFTDLPAGNYTVSVGGTASGLVTKNGLSSQQEQVSVVGGDTKTVNYEFDYPGAIPVNFTYKTSSGSPETTATADSVVAYHSQMSAARVFTSTSGGREPTVTASQLFPFSSTYLIYAGSCASNNPDPNDEGVNAAAVAKVAAPAGSVVEPAVKLQIPALELVVKNGSSLVSGARITITDTECDDAKGNSVKRVYTSNQKGLPSNSSTGVAELGLPWGTYDICASARISGNNRRKELTDVTVKSLTAAISKTIDLGSSGYSSSTCP